MFTKKMITLMVLATMLVAGAALAGDNYTVYGKLHTSIDYMDDTQDSKIMMANNTSRFGVKGSKDLNENCDLIWQFESSLNLAQFGSDYLARRNSFLGLTGEWGTFLFGIHDTPFKTIGRKATFFFDELGDFRQMTMGWDRRLDEVLVYASPDFSGFGFVLGYQLAQDGLKDNEADYTVEEAKTAFSGSAFYKKDALYAGVAYEALGSGYADAYSDGDAMVYGDGPAAIRATAKYDFGNFALAGLFQTITYQYADEDSEGNDIFSDLTQSTFGLEGKFIVNDTYSVKGAYYMANPNTDAEAIDNGNDIDESDNGYNMLALGLDRNLTKKTYMYVQFAMMMNGEASDKGLGGPGHGSRSYAPEVLNPDTGDYETAMGESPMGFSWGLVTKF